MLNDSEKKYYSRHILLHDFGEDKQLMLKAARVLVIGAGGLGCPVLQYLGAAGVGTIGIMDGDTVDESNLHRQVLYTYEDIGHSKAESAARKINQLNPHIQLAPINAWITTDNALDIMASYDVVVDCSDNFETRYLVNDACVILNKPLVYGAISQFEGQVSVFNYEDGPTYRCLFPEPPAPEEAPNCSEIGVLGVLPGVIGTYQALECIKLLSNTGNLLSGKLLIISTLNQNHLKLTIPSIEENKQITDLGEYNQVCVQPVDSITYEQYLSRKEQVFLLDVRNTDEYDHNNIGGVLIPLGELKSRLNELPLDQEIVVMCHSGKRSKKACSILQEKGFNLVLNFEGGIQSVN